MKQILVTTPLALYGVALQVVLAVVAVKAVKHGWGPAALFVLTAVLVIIGIATSSGVLVGLALVVSLIGPSWAGVLMDGRVNPLHIAVRAAIAAACFAAWWWAERQR